MTIVGVADSDAATRRPAATEFLICGSSASTMRGSLESLGVAVFDPSGIHARLVDANGGMSDESIQLRVPIVPGSVWTRLTQVVSKQRSESVCWAVVADDLSLFVPLWKHLMPGAHIVVPPMDAAQTVKDLLHV